MNDTQWWEAEWQKRITPEGIKFNTGKVDILCKKLWERPILATLSKLEIGCGTGYHVASMAKYNPKWQETYTGIDLSESAIKKAVKYGLNATVADIFKYDPGCKFDAFLLLDVLEHIRDHNGLAKKIKELANEKYAIYANVPLYLSESPDGQFERSVDANSIGYFLDECGLKDFAHEIYGLYGFPYMWIEATNEPGFITIAAS